ncbi:MAG TPA: hypothetical protein VFU76_03175 [Terriglobales bacterium]|nr:hypothetical protein [Terriglobales bacterium]
MILLMTAASIGEQCSQALRAATRHKVHLATDFGTAEEFLRTQEVQVVVFDDSTISSNCTEAVEVMKLAGAAAVVEVNFALHAEPRVIREVQHALHRYQQQRIKAQNAVRAELESQIKGELTGIMVASQMALYTPSLPPKAQSKMQEVFHLAERLRERLRSEL